MYYAAKSYPGERDGMKLYITQSVTERLQGARNYVRAYNCSFLHMQHVTGIHRGIWRCVKNGKGLSLYPYLMMANYFQWNLKHDPNYCYATVKYPPADLARRIERLFPYNTNLYEACRSIDVYLGFYKKGTTWRTIHYDPYREVRDYGAILQWIAGNEYYCGYSDAIVLED